VRPLRNVIYIQTQNSWLHKDNENLVLKVEKETKARVPIHKLQGLVCFGQVTVSPYLMARNRSPTPIALSSYFVRYG
jgi:CRISP-associated protein Cas1